MMRLLHNYFFWSYERGSVHFDVMVTAILLFIFVSPHYINFNDKPVTTIPLHASEVLVKESKVNGDAQFVYEVRAADLADISSDEATQASLLRVIEPIAGNVTLETYQPVRDGKGKIAEYDVTVSR